MSEWTKPNKKHRMLQHFSFLLGSFCLESIKDRGKYCA